MVMKRGMSREEIEVISVNAAKERALIKGLRLPSSSRCPKDELIHE
jgi:hypothetical protein